LESRTGKIAAYVSLLRGLLKRGPSDVPSVASDDYEDIKAAVSGKLHGVEWQRCTLHFVRNILALGQ
jgi:putative transposase